MGRQRLLALVEATLAVTFWGASFVGTKIALRDVSPATIIWLRFGMGFVVLGAFILARRQIAWPAPRDLGYFALLGFLGVPFHQWLQATGLQTTQATTTAWIVSTIPVFIAILGRLFLGERLPAGRILGILIAAAGVLLVVSRGNPAQLAIGQFASAGDFLILASAVNWAVFSVLSRRGLQTQPAARMMFYVMALGWLMTWPLLLAGPGFAEIGRLSGDGWAGVLFLGVFCSGLAYIFWYDALKIIPASQVGVLLYLNPVVATFTAGFLLSETLNLGTFLGIGTILLGLWLVNRSPAQPVHLHARTAASGGD